MNYLFVLIAEGLREGGPQSVEQQDLRVRGRRRRGLRGPRYRPGHQKTSNLQRTEGHLNHSQDIPERLRWPSCK